MKAKTILLVGTSGVGHSFANTPDGQACRIAMILAEVGMTMDDAVIVGDKQTTGNEILEKISQIPQPEPVVMELTNTRLPEPEYFPTKREIENVHPFSKFMGRNKRKW